ncbi:MAG: DUF177 domain-containing protein [Bacilli bacterium]|nr:DUF177 domain-containing protein [Bacilli bacterium]
MIKLIIDLIRLRNGIVKKLVFDEYLTIEESLYKEVGVLKMNPVHVEGSIYKDAMDEIVLKLHVESVMVLPCAVTLEEVNVPFEIEKEDLLLNLFEEIDENIKNVENTLDILPIIWENILVEIPMRVVSENAASVHLEGDGWKLLTDEEEKEIINPEFEKLKNLL